VSSVLGLCKSLITTAEVTGYAQYICLSVRILAS